MDIIERIEKGISKLTITKLSDNAPAYIRAREQEIELMDLAKLGKQMQWVSVAETLPKEGEMVLIYSTVIKAFGVSDIVGELINMPGAHFRVTHWMSLPPTPKGAE